MNKEYKGKKYMTEKDYKNVNAMICWVKCKLGVQKIIQYICLHAPMYTERKEKEVILGDINAKVWGRRDEN